MYTDFVLTAICILLFTLGGKIVQGFNGVIEGLSAIYEELKRQGS